MKKDKDTFVKKDEDKQTVVLVNDLLCPPGRHSRPVKLVVFMRGPPGSGKTYTARLIKVSYFSSIMKMLYPNFIPEG